MNIHLLSLLVFGIECPSIRSVIELFSSSELLYDLRHVQQLSIYRVLARGLINFHPEDEGQPLSLDFTPFTLNRGIFSIVLR